MKLFKTLYRYFLPERIVICNHEYDTLIKQSKKHKSYTDNSKLKGFNKINLCMVCKKCGIYKMIKINETTNY